MSAAEEAFRAGDLAAALAHLQAEIRQHPQDVRLRIFLAQLLMVLGQWERALTQLNVLEELDASTLPMVRTYQSAIQCEQLRTSVFAGERAPMVFGDPQPWVAMLIQALALFAQGHQAQAAELRASAFDAAPASNGVVNGTEFAWIADADSRLGPVLEVLVNGAYYWMPFNRLRSAQIEAPTDVRDLVWLPAQLTLENGGEVAALIPVRYAGSELQDDAQIRMSRKTQWQTIDEDAYVGLGQRVFSTDAADVGLLELRQLSLHAG